MIDEMTGHSGGVLLNKDVLRQPSNAGKRMVSARATAASYSVPSGSLLAHPVVTHTPNM
jgi:hypothetical protein